MALARRGPELTNLRDVTLGQYVPGQSALHKADPRAKLVAAVVFSAAVFAATGWPAFSLLAAYVALAARWARLPITFLARGVRPLLPFMAFAGLIHLFFTPGEPAPYAGALGVTKEGLAAAGQMAARLTILLTGVSLVTLTTTPLALTDGLERLLGPFRRIGLPAHEIAMMMTIALRFIPTLGEELDKVMKAQLARGAALEEGGLGRRIRSLLPLLVPLFASVFRRADELGMAMEARGYRGGLGRTKMHEPVLRWIDWAGLGLHGALCAAAVWLL